MLPQKELIRLDLGFNRYMVECESVKTAGKNVAEAGFNRYMVECESKF